MFIGPFDSLDVEADRKLPLVGTRDINSGDVEWNGLGIVNPFCQDGSLASLAEYPRMRRYFERHGEALRARHVAKTHPKSWYRTIDRIYPELTYRPKLLIPDIKGEAQVVYESGQFYPHHNLYYITATDWDLKALQAVLRSGIAKLFVSIYSTPMRGGYLRFQAQYLRRIRIPRWQDVPGAVRTVLVSAAAAGDVDACNSAVFEAYRLSPEERASLGGDGEQPRRAVLSTRNWMFLNSVGTPTPTINA